MSSLIDVVELLRLKSERENANENAGYVSGTWTPTFTGFSVNPTSVVARYIQIGKLCVAMVVMGGAGTSNATGFTVSAPIQAATVAGMTWMGVCAYAQDNSAGISGAYAQIASAGTVFTLNKATGAVWTGANGKLADFTILYETI